MSRLPIKGLLLLKDGFSFLFFISKDYKAINIAAMVCAVRYFRSHTSRSGGSLCIRALVSRGLH